MQSTQLISKTSLEDFKNEWLIDVTEGAPSTVTLGNRFAQKIISQWLELDTYSDDIIFCDGTGDGGIDVAYLHKGQNSDEEHEGDTWYIVQSKYGSAFQGTNTLLGEGKKFFDTMEGHRTSLSSISSDVTERLKTFIANSSDKDKLIFVFATVDSMSIEDKRALEDIKILGKNKIGQIFDVETVCIETIYNRLTEQEESKEEKLGVNLVGNLVPSGDELLVGSVKLIDLFNFLKEYKMVSGDLDLIYEKNVRKFLGNKRKVNRGIEKTLLEKPERFGLYNNGITIVVNDFEENDGAFNLTEPFIVNGCQTTKSIWSVLVKKLESGGTGHSEELEHYKEKLEKGIVVLKVVKVGSQGEDLLYETTRYTNSQNAVTEKDFLALEKDFRNWADQMASKYNIFLEIQRGGWESRKAYQKQNPQAKPYFTENVNAFDLIKVYSAGWLGEAGLAFGKNPPFSPGGSIFNKIVNDTDFSLNDLYAAYLLSKQAEKFKFGKGAEKQSRGQTRYLYFMVFIELLKHVILKAELSDYYNDKHYYSKCIINLSKPENMSAFRDLQNSAIEIIDEYMAMEGDNSYTKEPKFRGDINSFLKWEQLGTDGSTPILNDLIGINKRLLTRTPEYDTLVKCVKNAKIID
ncbi:AIPR family protein [Peribacillus simplex]|uniref:AIPR family protein n=1 Tax=Peribacillus simplex TaxID=1478 RepID=UPI001C86A364|nr:AIPR family protein [Peribacillus simplex]